MFKAARFAGIILGFPLVLGFVWFFAYHGPMEITYFVLSRLAVPALPKRFASSTSGKHLVRVVCVLAAVTAIPMIGRDVALVNGADHGAVIIRSILIGIELIHFVETTGKRLS